MPTRSGGAARIYLILLGVSIAAWCYVKFVPELPPPPIVDAKLKEMRPQADQPPGHASAADCRECHEHNHSTWFESYHRTMTQEVKPETVLGNFDDVTVNFPQLGNAIHLSKRDGYPWARFENAPEVSPPGEQDRKEFPLVMSTGSHHMQFYWFPIGASRSVAIMPIGHMVKENRWIPLQHSFLAPPSHGFETQTAQWNNRCVRCHATFPEMKSTGEPLVYDTRVTEFGISCEACHGPAGNHAAIQRNAKNPDPNFDTNLMDQVVNPKELDHQLSTAVCASCHSLHKPAFWKPHIAGQPLGRDRRLIDSDGIKQRMDEMEDAREPDDEEEEESSVHRGETDEFLAGLFWPDGHPRVTGSEYNGLLKSSCFTQGELSCISCHKLHQSQRDQRPVKEWASDQLKVSAMGNTACTQCHAEADYDSPKHTHHAAGSSGGSCYNCHMPYTTYGLLTSIRSHTISSPETKSFRESGRPTACNLCHLDETLEWTANHLEEWYDIPKPNLNKEDRQVSNIAALALRGDAPQRAIAAYAMGWEPAVKASDPDWMPAYLATLLKDPYAAVRYMAEKSLRRHAGFADIKVDFVDLPAETEKSSAAALQIWKERKPASISKAAPSQVLLNGEGQLDEKRFNELYAKRNNRDIMIVE